MRGGFQQAFVAVAVHRGTASAHRDRFLFSGGRRDRPDDAGERRESTRWSAARHVFSGRGAFDELGRLQVFDRHELHHAMSCGLTRSRP